MNLSNAKKISTKQLNTLIIDVKTMEEPQRRSMLNFVEGNRVSDICRLVYCAKINESSENVLKAFSTAAKEYFSESVTGLLLIYPQYMIHLIEGPEEEIFQLCRHLFDKCYRFIESTKCFPVQVEIVGRFFDKWYARKASEYYHSRTDKLSTNNILDDNFENASAIYKKTLINLYKFYRELRLLSNKNHVIIIHVILRVII